MMFDSVCYGVAGMEKGWKIWCVEGVCESGVNVFKVCLRRRRNVGWQVAVVEGVECKEVGKNARTLVIWVDGKEK